MLKKKWFLSILLIVVIASFSIPKFEVNAESEWQILDKQIQDIKKQEEEASKRKKDIENQLNDIENEQMNLEKEIEQIEVEINETEQKIFALESEIESVTQEAKKAAEDLEEAIIRVEKRDELLKTRVRLMYSKGDVQYIEVLLGSNSFSDFIQRFNSLQKIIDSDKRILLENINDKNIIETKKKEIDQALVELEELYSESEELRASLITKKDSRQVKIASLDEKKSELEDIKQEEEEMLIELALKESELVNKQQLLIYNGGLLSWPVPASTRITSEYGMRIDPFTGNYTGHKGIDIGKAPGTDTLYGADIVAAADGIVIVASYVSGYGNTVMIDHGSGLWTLYGHIRNGGIIVNVGDKVEKGQKIAEVGSTGRSTGPHLHFEVRKDNVPVNPWDYLGKF